MYGLGSAFSHKLNADTRPEVVFRRRAVPERMSIYTHSKLSICTHNIYLKICYYLFMVLELFNFQWVHAEKPASTRL